MEDLTIEESVRIVLELAEQSVLTDEQASESHELNEEQAKQKQAIRNVEYNLGE